MTILNLQLYTTNLNDQIEFYRDIMGYPCIKCDEQNASFQVGETKLTFIKSNKALPYHFAINIPSNKIEHARDWLQSQLNIKDIKIHHFDFWDADAIYFYDNDQNIVEFIDRKGLRTDNSSSIFDVSQSINISEIGIPCSDVNAIREQVKKEMGVTPYGNISENFNALGNEHGLFIVINRLVKKWYPNSDIAHPFEFKVMIETETKEIYDLEFKNEKLDIDKKS